MKVNAVSTVVMALGLTACAKQGLVADSAVKIPIENVLTAIRCEFVDYVRTQPTRFDPKKPWVIQGKLVVSAETGTSAGVSGKLTPFSGPQTGFFGIGASVESRNTSTSTIDFDLDPGTRLKGDCPTAEPGFGLASWLQAVETAKSSSTGLTLRDRSYVFGLVFAVGSNVNASAGFGVQPLGINAEAARKRDDVQTLTIAIKPKPEREIIYIQQVQPARAPAAPPPAATLAVPSDPKKAAPPATMRGRYIYKPIDLSPELERKQRELLGSP